MKVWLLQKRWRIILTGILIVAIPLVAFSTYLHFAIHAAINEKITKELNILAQLGAHAIEAKLNGDICFGKAYASRPYLLEGLIRRDKIEMLKHLKNLISDNASIERAFITTPEGVQIANYPEMPETIGKDFSDREWYKGISKNWAPYISELYISMEKPKRYLFSIAIPMKYEGSNVGILVMQPIEDYIKSALGNIDPSRKGHIFVVDRKGNLVYHPEIIINRLIDFSGDTAVRKVMQGMEGIEKSICSINQQPSISAYHPVSNCGWGVIMEKPKEVVFAPLRQTDKWTAIITTLMLLSGGFFAYRWSELFASTKKTETDLKETEQKLKDTLSNVEKQVAERTDDLRRIKDHIMRHSEELKRFAESTSILLMLPTSENVYEAACDKALKIFNLQLAWLGILSENSRVSPVAWSGNVTDEAVVTRFILDTSSAEDSLSFTAIKTQMPQIVDDVFVDDRCQKWQQIAELIGCRSAMSLPLISSENRVIGTLNFYSARPNFFIRDRLEVLKIFSNYISFVIENRWLVEGLEEKVRERTKELEDANYELEKINVELILRKQEAEEARHLAEEANEAKSDFLANMSHELRTPLNAIIGFSEILEDQLYGPLNEKQMEYIRDVCSSGKHLLSLINDILDLSKVEAGKVELELGTFLLRNALRNCMSMLKEKAMKHNINLSMKLDPEADIEIEADERRFKQIMFNLLSNAVKFTPEGGSVNISARLCVGVRKDAGTDLCVCPKNNKHTGSPLQDFLEISVSDTGIGIKPEDMGRLFKEFSQLETSYTKKFEGTGLGLALTKKLVELHGGQIWAESEFGKGSMFTFVIPVRQ